MSSIKTCKKCGYLYPDTETTCPTCGARNWSGFKGASKQTQDGESSTRIKPRHWVMAVSLGLILAIVLIWNDKSDDYWADQEALATSQTIPYTVYYKSKKPDAKFWQIRVRVGMVDGRMPNEQELLAVSKKLAALAYKEWGPTKSWLVGIKLADEKSDALLATVSKQRGEVKINWIKRPDKG